MFNWQNSALSITETQSTHNLKKPDITVKGKKKIYIYTVGSLYIENG